MLRGACNMHKEVNMAKYLLKRILYGAMSIAIVVAIIMIMVYSLLDREKIFRNDPVYQKNSNNSKITYMYQKWEEYGYLDYVTYEEYLNALVKAGELDEETRKEAASLGKTPEKDSEITAEYVAEFKAYYEARGYEVIRLDVVNIGRKVASGGQQRLFASKDIPLINRLFGYFAGLLSFDNIHEVEGDVGERGLSFTLYDPAYGGDKFSPAIMGNGTQHKYLLYCDGRFPFIHQNLVTINLGTSYSVNQGIDVFATMTLSQGSYVRSMVSYPTGLKENSADDLHSATYVAGSREMSQLNIDRFADDYTNVSTIKAGKSRMGYSFIIGIVSTFLSYLIGIPLGILMARKKDKFIDKLGMVYIVFMIAVPSLAYIFLFKAIGGKMGLPTTFDMETTSRLIYVLPIVSLMLPSVANLMKWLRRYMVDQMNADYVKFARSGGLSEGEIFRKHILKNAAIPIVHGIPGAVLFAMTGAFITERVYVVPGTGKLLIEAINMYDNGVIVGVAFFYAVLTVVSIILGDVLMALVDPRISFTTRDR